MIIEDQDLGALQALPEIGIADRRLYDEVDRPPAHAFQPFQKAEIGVGVGAGGQGKEFDHEVEVAIRPVFAHRSGAEKREPADIVVAAERFDLSPVGFDGRGHGAISRVPIYELHPAI